MWCGHANLGTAANCHIAHGMPQAVSTHSSMILVPAGTPLHMGRYEQTYSMTMLWQLYAQANNIAHGVPTPALLHGSTLQEYMHNLVGVL